MFSFYPLMLFILNIFFVKNSFKNSLKKFFIFNFKKYFSLPLKEVEKCDLKNDILNLNFNFLKKKKDLNYLKAVVKTLNNSKTFFFNLKNLESIFNINSFLISIFFFNMVVFKKYYKVDYLKKNTIAYYTDDYFDFLIFFIFYSNYLNIYFNKNLDTFYIFKNNIKKDSNYLNKIENLKNFYEKVFLSNSKNIFNKYKNILIFNNENNFFYKNIFINNYHNYWKKKNKQSSFFENLNIKVYNTYVNKYFNLDGLNKFNIFFLRKNRVFNKGRYSRNRQNYRTGFYWCLYVNIIAVFSIYFFFYRFTFNFGYIWWLVYLFFFIFFFNKFFKYKLFILYNFFNNLSNIFFFYFSILNNLSIFCYNSINFLFKKFLYFFKTFLIFIRFYI